MPAHSPSKKPLQSFLAFLSVSATCAKLVAKDLQIDFVLDCLAAAIDIIKYGLSWFPEKALPHPPVAFSTVVTVLIFLEMGEGRMNVKVACGKNIHTVSVGPFRTKCDMTVTISTETRPAI